MSGPSLSTRLLLAVLGPAALVLAAGGWVSYRATHRLLEDELGRALSRVAAVVAAGLTAERVLSVERGDELGEGTRTYRSLKAQLGAAREAAGLRRVLVVDTALRARVDVGGGLPPLAEAPELLRDRVELEGVRQGRPAASQVLFVGTDGRSYKSGYAPVLGPDGQVAALVAVEGEAAYFGPLQSLGRLAASFFLALFGALALAAVLSARSVTGPLQTLVGSALRIGGGDLETSVPPQPGREVGTLSRQLEAMRGALQDRRRQMALMLGGVAHEVKNPLGGMELFLGLAREELSGHPALSHLERVERELRYLKRIVDDFLLFAREERLQRTGVAAERLLEAAASHVRPEAEARGVSVQASAAPATLQVDEGLLTVALVNLVKNAVQVSPPGAAVSLRGTAVAGGAYQVVVADAGPGVPQELQARIFEPFFTTREQGSGLGLPLARKVVEAHGGTLSLASQPRDTRFTVSLPPGVAG